MTWLTLHVSTGPDPTSNWDLTATQFCSHPLLKMAFLALGLDFPPHFALLDLVVSVREITSKLVMEMCV